MALLTVICANKSATVIMTSEATAILTDDDLQFIADGVITLVKTEERRFIQVDKYHASAVRMGRHTHDHQCAGPACLSPA